MLPFCSSLSNFFVAKPCNAGVPVNGKQQDDRHENETGLMPAISEIE
jgi:hypothetical protein